MHINKILIVLVLSVFLFSLAPSVSAQTNTTNTTNTTGVECTDSDGGINYYAKGMVSGNLENFMSQTSMSDTCIDSKSGIEVYEGDTLQELYCESSTRFGWKDYTCPNGCRDGACICKSNLECANICTSQSCPVYICQGGTCVPNPGMNCRYLYYFDDNNKNCDQKQFCGAFMYYGLHTFETNDECLRALQGPACGNGVCEAGETQESCPQDCVRKCPASIDLNFNKKNYYPGDYFEVTVKIYDKYNNLMPNRMFSVYNERDGTTSTFYTDSAGIYRSTSNVPSDPKYNGEWTFVASVSEEGCQYVSDKETIYINISNKCGDGYCDYGEKEIVCDTVCPQIACATGEKCVMPPCQSLCHALCPKDCTPNCGNGVCDTSVCQDAVCPIPENEKNCPEDCRPAKYCGSQSSDPNCICEAGYTKESFEEPCRATQNEIQGSAASATGAIVSGASEGTTVYANNVIQECGFAKQPCPENYYCDTRQSACNQKDFKMAFIFIVKNQSDVTAQRLERLNSIKSKFSQYFHKATWNLATMDTSTSVYIVSGITLNPDNINYDINRVLEKFYQSNNDDYDFITIYTSFNLDLGNIASFHNGAFNTVYSKINAVFPEKSKLKGTNYIGNVDSFYVINNDDLATLMNVNQILHENEHQWACWVGDLICDKVHYYYGLDGPIDLENPLNGKMQWVSNNDGTYKTPHLTGDTILPYHPFTLYFMGLLPESEYSKKFKIYDAGVYPNYDVRADGTYASSILREVSVNDIILNNGQICCEECKGICKPKTTTQENIVNEQVKCVFLNSNSMQECYSDKGFGCRGISTCVADVYGKKGEKLTWKSGCGGYAYTVIDGQNEYAEFKCVPTTKMCTYYRCVPAYSSLYLSTDKYAYDIGEQVQIVTSPFQKGQLNLTELQVSVKDPYGQTQSVTLKPICETIEGQICPECAAGVYCPPCKSFTSCSLKGTYTGTKSVGIYDVSSPYTGNDVKIYPTQFRVYDYSLLKKYLILEDIDGFKYKDAKLQPGPENIIAYVAGYEKDGRQHMALVADFENRDKLEKYLNDIFRENPSNEEKIDGNYIYILSNGGQKVYFWTYKTFLIGIVEQTYMAMGAAKSVIPNEVKPGAAATATQTMKMEPKEAASASSGGGFFTGMITGAPVANSEPVNCGADSLYPECVCKSDETKESFAPPCNEGVCGKHYRCRQQEPTELLKAYLDRYPSDIKSTGTECEQKDGYCISSQDSCKQGFGETGFACKTSSEKCCVIEVDKGDFLEIVMKLEGIRVKMDTLERQSNALADYYKSTGDNERANKFSDVAEMFKTAKKMIDDIIAKIRANLDNPESIRDDIKKDINNLKDYINSILKRMVS